MLMTNTAKITAIVLVGAVVLLLGALLLRGSGSSTFGALDPSGTVVPNEQWFTGGIRIGSGNYVNKIANLYKGKCNPTFYGTSFAASSTGTFACAVTGVQAGDLIFGDLPNTEGGTFLGFDISATYATTTGVVGFTYQNFTGAATSSFAQATTGVEYLDLGK